jgi:hypothetical protein
MYAFCLTNFSASLQKFSLVEFCPYLVVAEMASCFMGFLSDSPIASRHLTHSISGVVSASDPKSSVPLSGAGACCRPKVPANAAYIDPDLWAPGNEEADVSDVLYTAMRKMCACIRGAQKGNSKTDPMVEPISAAWDALQNIADVRHAEL